MSDRSQRRSASALDWKVSCFRPDPKTIAAADVLPSEDRQEFADFCEAVRCELCPSGAWKEEIVFRIAKLRWRLNHLDIFRRASEVRKAYGGCLKDFYAHTDAMHAMFRQCANLEEIVVNLKRELAEHKNEPKKYPEKVEFDLDPKLAEKMNSLRAEIDRCLNELQGLPAKQDSVVPAEIKNEAPSMMEAAAAALECIMNTSPHHEDFEQIFERESAVIDQWTEQAIGRAEMLRRRAQRAREERDGTELELAFFSEAITVENYLHELKLAQALEKALAANLRMLWDLQRHERKKWQRIDRIIAGFGSSLLPPYRKR